MRRPAIAVMAKAPEAGQVKTRLVPPLTREEAAELYRCLCWIRFFRSAHSPGSIRTSPIPLPRRGHKWRRWPHKTSP